MLLRFMMYVVIAVFYVGMLFGLLGYMKRVSSIFKDRERTLLEKVIYFIVFLALCMMCVMYYNEIFVPSLAGVCV